MKKFKKLEPFHFIGIFFIMLFLILTGMTFHNNFFISLVFLFFGIIAIESLFDDLL